MYPYGELPYSSSGILLPHANIFFMVPTVKNSSRTYTSIPVIGINKTLMYLY